jgi:ionotropic glutamate receptor
MSYLNASKEIIIQKTWGYKNQTTGLYSGMAGDLQTGVANLGGKLLEYLWTLSNRVASGTPLFFTTDRIDIIDYIAATTPTYMKFIFKAPPLTYVTNVFTLPFAASVWHYCFVMVAVVVIFVYLVVLWEWKEVKFRKTISGKRGDTLRPNIFDVIMMEIGAITQQGSDVEPQSIAGRIIFIFTLTTLMFLYTSYSANIVALLQSTTDSIKTLDDLLHSRIKLGVEDIVYAHYYFEVSRE